MRYGIVLAPEAIDDLKRLSAGARARLEDALEIHLRYQPMKISRSRIKRLRGLSRPEYRLRVDDMRVFYDVQKRRVEILAIVTKPDAAAWLAREGRKV